MSTRPSAPQNLRILSIVEALTVTGPVKPLLMFASSARNGSAEYPAVAHTVMTTRRRASGRNDAPDELYTAVKADGLEYITIQERAAFDLGVLPKMRRAVQRIKPDIVETHDSKSHFLFFVLRLLHTELRQPKWIAFHHGYTRTTWKIALYQQLDRLTLRYADRVVTLCRPFAQDLRYRGVAVGNLSVISNAAPERAAPDAKAIAHARVLLGIAPEECLVLCVGRLSNEKGQDDLIDALRRTLAAGSVPVLRLVIVGDGPERRRLENLAAPLGRSVLFSGYLADPWALFHAADIFVLPSHSEGSPLVIFEAMAAGTPIIATAVGGVPEILVDSETGLLVPPREPAALARTLAALSRERALQQRLALAARAALVRFSPRAYAHNLSAIYAQVLQTTTAAAASTEPARKRTPEGR
jgi:glycosyltransferase involved in cell wall biosynthesis